MSEHIPQDTLDKIKQKDLRNIAEQAKAGKPLSRDQLKRLEEHQVTDDGRRQYVRIEEGDISAANLARVLGLSERRIKQLYGEGIITKSGHGRYMFPQNVHEYLEWAKKRGSEEKTELQQQYMQARIERTREDIERIRRERMTEIEDLVWQETMDCLAEYKSELERLDLEAEDYEKLNNALTKACSAVKERYAERYNQQISADTTEGESG